MLADSHEGSDSHADQNQYSGKLVEGKDELANLHGKAWVEERRETSGVLKLPFTRIVLKTSNLHTSQQDHGEANPGMERIQVGNRVRFSFRVLVVVVRVPDCSQGDDHEQQRYGMNCSVQ